MTAKIFIIRNARTHYTTMEVRVCLNSTYWNEILVNTLDERKEINSSFFVHF